MSRQAQIKASAGKLADEPIAVTDTAPDATGQGTPSTGYISQGPDLEGGSVPNEANRLAAVGDWIARDEAMLNALEVEQAATGQLRGELSRRKREVGLEAEKETGRVVLKDRAFEEAQDALNLAHEEKRQVATEKNAAEVIARQQEDEVLTRVTTELDTIRGEIKAFEIDHNRYYKNTWAAVGSAVAMAIGAYAQGLAAGQGMRIPNTAKEIFDAAVERDIRTQEAEFSKLRVRAAQTSNVFARWMNVFNNRSASRGAARIAAYDVAAMKIENLTNVQANVKAQEASKAMLEEIQNKRNKEVHSLNLMSTQAGIASAKLEFQAAKKKADIKPLKWVSDLIGGHAQFMTEAGGLIDADEKLREQFTSGDNPASLIARMLTGKVPAYMTDEKDFNIRSEQLAVRLMHSLSGAAVTDTERKWYISKIGPKSGKSVAARQTAMQQLLINHLMNASPKFKALPLHYKQYFTQTNPELGHLLYNSTQMTAYVNRLLGIGVKSGKPLTPQGRVQESMHQGGRPGLSR